jgi:RNA polymerase sigma-70 factor (ECF subfamily)
MACRLASRTTATASNGGRRRGVPRRTRRSCAERAALVHRCIAELLESCREIPMLREIEDLDAAETTATVGITKNAVKIRLHRARQALRTRLDPHTR